MQLIQEVGEQYRFKRNFRRFHLQVQTCFPLNKRYIVVLGVKNSVGAIAVLLFTWSLLFSHQNLAPIFPLTMHTRRSLDAMLLMVFQATMRDGFICPCCGKVLGMHTIHRAFFPTFNVTCVAWHFICLFFFLISMPHLARYNLISH